MTLVREARWLFGLGAGWNVVAMAALLATYEMQFAGQGYDVPYNPLWTTMAMGLIVVFGVSYGLVAVWPQHFAGIAVVGVIGKLWVVGQGAVLTMQGVTPPGYLAALGVDVVFAGLYAWWWWRWMRVGGTG